MNSSPASPSPSPSPAQPILASSLLTRERTRSDHSQHQWKTGIPFLDKSLPSNLWTSNKIIGIIDDSDGTLAFSNTQEVPLITQLMVSHLASIHQNDSSNASKSLLSSPPPPPPPSAATTIYIITSLSTPSTSTSPTSPSTLAAALEKASMPPSLLDSVSLLQYFDFAGLADAVAEVSRTLFVKQHSQPGRHPNHGSSSTTPDTDTNHSILLLSGLVATLSSLTRTSGPVSASALLAPLLRSLTQLSRTNPNLLLLLLLEPEFLDSLSPPSLSSPNLAGGRGGHGGGGDGAAQQLGAFLSYASQRREKGRLRQGGSAGFAQNAGKAGVNASLAGVMNVLGCVVDVLVLVHTIAEGDGSEEKEKRRDAVEVLVDRVGDMTGWWAVR